ncbi:hypothetical protein J41TS12_08170 [Paenibacillus antibioticophila]|uniref:Uncharacterized protein n=1 Tax=Paenibacillus antibioticophila TaxID=1274374 RepID=A0A919XPE5_9BACL|nr:hypothetical protein [Paenibacillus antibioticophila]GIO35956.1 hypothetical protein J41TS12_08170 [Paenibacillus antibioticophila]
MIAVNKLSFFIEYSYSKQIERFFGQYDIQVISPEKGVRTSEIRYQIPISFDPKENMKEKIEEIMNRLLNLFPIDRIGEAICFEYSNEDYDQAPFFTLYSTGNSVSANIIDNQSEMSTPTFCEACSLKERRLESSFLLDTSKLKNRYMINVDGMFWVVSEKMAELMSEWKITGYYLEEVVHRGKVDEKLPAYQLIINNSLPPFSPNVNYYYFVSEPEERCDVCGVRGKISYPYIYSKSDIENCSDDLYVLNEWNSNGSYVYHPLILSQRFRKLLLEHRITRDVRSLYESTYGPKDWFMEPVFIDNY